MRYYICVVLASNLESTACPSRPEPIGAGKTCHVNKKILFVDGDPSAFELYRQILQDEFEDEFEIATAVSGEEGLLVLRNDGPYATVIADMQMPGMDGVQFLGRARNLALSTMEC
jgi:CheY-like chemotaxis protein